MPSDCTVPYPAHSPTHLHQRQNPFSRGWWSSLFLLGLSLAGAVSVKYVGIFVVAIVGLYTASDLWDLWGDRTHNSISRVCAHFAARAGALIAVPIAVYLAIFALHFSLLPYSGTGDAFLSHSFQVRGAIARCPLGDLRSPCLLLRLSLTLDARALRRPNRPPSRETRLQSLCRFQGALRLGLRLCSRQHTRRRRPVGCTRTRIGTPSTRVGMKKGL
jgi:hypothetical protein